MDRLQAIGIALMFGLFYLIMVYNAPTEEEQAAMKHREDSLNAIKHIPAPDQDPAEMSDIITSDTATPGNPPAQEEETFTLENNLIRITFSNKGGRIIGATLKEHFKLLEDAQHNKTKVPLPLLDHAENRMEYVIKGVNGKTFRTGDLFFNAVEKNNTIVFSSNVDGVNFQQTYTLPPDQYTLETSVQAPGILNTTSADEITLNWIDYLDPLELNRNYEKYYSTVYYKTAEENPDYCSCRGDDKKIIDEEKVQWISHANQFFNTAVIPSTPFTSVELDVKMAPDDKADYLKVIHSKARLPIEQLQQGLAMKMYIGPNDFENLRAFGNDLEDVVPFGSSIFGTINRWIIRPLFNFLQSWIASAGLVIILLTIIVKLAVYPLTYKMLKSQTKMAVLKPEIEKLKGKFKDDQSQQQMETMKLYREYGVNPLGGCLPMVLQMPIWFALYRFFPASIEFRQASFLWADDLSSYDVIAYLPFDIPMFGSHISLFTILWVITTLIYTWYNSRLVDMSANPAMKYMQYFMPVMFLFFFNNYASGLTAYLMFSNIFNIGQTLVTKNFILDQEKLRASLEVNKSKPKKKGGFQQRLEQALKEQQRIQEERQKGKKKK